MGASTNIAGVPNYVLQAAIGDLANEAYTNAKKLTGTGIVSAPESVNTDTETYIGQLRWNQPLRPKINVGSLTDATKGQLTHGNQNMLTYVKTTRSAGTDVRKLEKVVTQQDGMKQFAEDQVETQTQDEHNSILDVLKGVAITEALIGAGTASGSAGLGGQTFDNDPTSARHGFYVDLGSKKLVSESAPGNIGASRARGLLDAFGMAFKDYEPSHAYLIADPSLMSDIRSANLVDSDKVRDGQVDLESIFQGKMRLIKSRAQQSLTPEEMTLLANAGGVQLQGRKISFLVLPGAVGFKKLAIPEPVGIDQEEASYGGFGTRELWYRWGYVAHPAGYGWAGSEEKFVSHGEYMAIRDGDGTLKPLNVATGIDEAVGTWARKQVSVLTLGILPIFHD